MSRIIAGSRRGRRLAAPPGDGTRPTTDRTREALFSALTSWAGRAAAAPEEALTGLAFADLFAGSGAVGLEAASRGAGPVLLVESDRRAAALAGRNARTVDLVVQIAAVPVERWVTAPADQRYDLIFADPPYERSTADVEDLVAALLDGGRLAEGGLVVLERSARSEPPTWPDALADHWERKYGETLLCFAQR